MARELEQSWSDVVESSKMMQLQGILNTIGPELERSWSDGARVGTELVRCGEERKNDKVGTDMEHSLNRVGPLVDDRKGNPCANSVQN